MSSPDELRSGPPEFPAMTMPENLGVFSETYNPHIVDALLVVT